MVCFGLLALAKGQIGGPPHDAPYQYKPFSYEYGVAAPEYGKILPAYHLHLAWTLQVTICTSARLVTGNDYSKTEHQDENGNLEGQYRTLLPDGRVQVVTYHANPVEGYVAEVTYEGEATIGGHGPSHRGPGGSTGPARGGQVGPHRGPGPRPVRSVGPVGPRPVGPPAFRNGPGPRGHAPALTRPVPPFGPRPVGPVGPVGPRPVGPRPGLGLGPFY